jgi:hypothetical protein
MRTIGVKLEMTGGRERMLRTAHAGHPTTARTGTVKAAAATNRAGRRR